mmetsp:Transcript_11152/g.24143  ORF Transcript_11152/g.24143 Transcript_11152/m.24143 type:complete len:251 (-) Transcript_11152:153-905(-)
MTQNTKAGNVRARRCAIFDHETAAVSVQTSHGTNSSVHHVLREILRCSLLVETFLPEAIVLVSPLLYIDRNLSSERLGQNDYMAKLCSIRSNKFSFGNDRRGHTADDGPRIQYRLSTGYGGLSLIAGIFEPTYHLLRTDGTLVLGHIPTGSEEHQDKITMLHTLGIQIRKHIGGTDPTLQIWRIHEGEEKVRGGNAVVSLSRFAHAAVQRNPAVGRAEVEPVPQAKICKHRLQLVLRYLAGSSLERAPIG